MIFDTLFGRNYLRNSSPAVTAKMKSWTALGAAVFKEHRALLWIIALQVEVSWWMCVVAERQLWSGTADAYTSVISAAVIFGVMALAARLVQGRPRELPFAASYRESLRKVREEILTARWLASVVIVLATLPLSLGVFSAAKQTIPIIHPFAWDSSIEQFGLRLHGGRHMWEWLQPLVGYPIITVLLDAFYHKGWTLMSLGALALVIVSPPSRLRRRYITASVLLLFLVGTLSALALSSAGPPYYDQIVHGPDPYAALFTYLSDVGKHSPLISSEGRDVLWTAYRHRVDAFGLGISAMPSMHVATAALAACLAFAVGPWLGLMATLCTIVVAIASVSLGWHYALDGYVGAALAIAVWWLAGRIEREVVETVPESVQPRRQDFQPRAWVPPSRRRGAATLPDGLVAVASADDATAWTGSMAQTRRPMRTS